MPGFAGSKSRPVLMRPSGNTPISSPAFKCLSASRAGPMSAPFRSTGIDRSARKKKLNTGSS